MLNHQNTIFSDRSTGARELQTLLSTESMSILYSHIRSMGDEAVTVYHRWQLVLYQQKRHRMACSGGLRPHGSFLTAPAPYPFALIPSAFRTLLTNLPPVLFRFSSGALLVLSHVYNGLVQQVTWWHNATRQQSN